MVKSIFTEHLPLSSTMEGPASNSSPTDSSFVGSQSPQTVITFEMSAISGTTMHSRFAELDVDQTTATPPISDISDHRDGLVSNPYGNGRVLYEPKKLDYSIYEAAKKAQEKRSRLSTMFSRRNKYFGVYVRLLASIILINIGGIIAYVWVNRHNTGYFDLSIPINCSAGNILLSVLIRQEYIVNTMYRICWFVPHSWPMWLRTRIAKFYEHGGLHSGAAVSGTLWLIVLSSLSAVNYQRGAYDTEALLITSCIILVLLFAIMIPALSFFRYRYHNVFEFAHRFIGWIVVGFFWLEIGLLIQHTATTSNKSAGYVTLRTASFWMNVVITFHIILPWLFLRKMAFLPVPLSEYALRLDFVSKYPHVSGIGLSISPWLEWHSFATYPRPRDGQNAHSIVISKAGDWTSSLILEPFDSYWVKGIPKTGLLSLAMMFKKVVVVTTGSGIAPCVSLTLSAYPRAERTKVCLVWNARLPKTIYGSDFYKEVATGHEYALIVDSTIVGRANLTALAYSVWKEEEAEAVFVISNRKLTRKIVDGLEEIGVPAFGPIWDS